jgi:hypothetical protein
MMTRCRVLSLNVVYSGKLCVGGLDAGRIISSIRVLWEHAVNCRLTVCAFLTLTLTPLATAQGTKSGGLGTTTGPPVAMPPSLNSSDPAIGQKAFISGRVVLDDGSKLTETATIQTLCRGHKQTVTHTDSHGAFSFELGDRASAAAAGISEADVDSSWNPSNAYRGNQQDWHECEAQAELPGFTSDAVDLSTRMSKYESVDIGRLVLHRLGHVEGLTISATSAWAPKEAQKAFEKGCRARPRTRLPRRNNVQRMCLRRCAPALPSARNRVLSPPPHLVHCLIQMRRDMEAIEHVQSLTGFRRHHL